MEPATTAITLIAGILTFVLRREFGALPMIVVATLVPYGQRLVIGGIGFDVVRMVLVCACVRIAFKGEYRDLRFSALDRVFLGWVVLLFLVPLLSGSATVARQFGFLLDYFVEYLVLRCLLPVGNEIEFVARTLIFAGVIVCLGMLLERTTGKNVFHLLGAPEAVTVREGEIRATAGFDHPILAGTFGALLLPLSWLVRKESYGGKVLWLTGMFCSLAIVKASKSSGPLYALLAGGFAIGLWPLRKHMRLLRNGMWVTLVLLHLIMTGPVWALLFRIPDALGLVAGSTSFHRFELIDLAIQHIGDWWLAGISLEQVAHWSWGINDLTNQFLLVGFSGGLLGMVLFVLVLVRAFSLTGRCSLEGEESSVRFRGWLLGCVLFAHVMAFIGVGYFSGFWFFLNLTFALIACYCRTEALAEGPETENVAEAIPMNA